MILPAPSPAVAPIVNEEGSMAISVLVPTLRRVHDLERCLKALQAQTKSAQEVCVIVRDTDGETQAFLQAFDNELLPLCVVIVTLPGQVAALNEGLNRATGDIVAILDDDAVPHLDWLERIHFHFLSDASIGGVGGRDWLYQGKVCDTRSAVTVGKLQWFGRAIGNHHLGVGNVREVDILKGANMSYRRLAIQELYFDVRLRGTGAQVHNDLAFSLNVKRRGWKLVYDPQVAIDHFASERFDEDQRQQFNAKALENMAHNETLVLAEHFPLSGRLVYFVYSFVVGLRHLPGFLQLARLIALGDRNIFVRYKVTIIGRIAGLRTFLSQECKS